MQHKLSGGSSRGCTIFSRFHHVHGQSSSMLSTRHCRHQYERLSKTVSGMSQQPCLSAPSHALRHLSVCRHSSCARLQQRWG